MSGLDTHGPMALFTVWYQVPLYGVNWFSGHIIEAVRQLLWASGSQQIVDRPYGPYPITH